MSRHRGDSSNSKWLHDSCQERTAVSRPYVSKSISSTPQVAQEKHITQKPKILMSNETELTGAMLLMYLMSRFNMTRQEALRNMKQNGHDISKL